MIKSSERYSSKNMCNNSFILHRLLIIIRDLNALDESQCKLKTYLQNSIIKLLSYLYSYFLILSISQLVSLLSSKNQFSITREVNLKIKEFNCGKAQSNSHGKWCWHVCFVALHNWWCNRIFDASVKFS